MTSQVLKKKVLATEPNADVYHQHVVSKSVKHEINVLSNEKQKTWPLFEIWLSGAGLCLTLFIYQNMKQVRKFSSRQLLKGSRIETLMDECCQQLALTKPLKVSESKYLSSPALYGVWKAEIILPHGLIDKLSDEEIRHIFLHELSHYKKADNWWNSLLLLFKSSIGITH